MSDLKFKLVFTAVDQALSPVKRLGAGLAGLGKAGEAAGRGAEKLDRSTSRLGRSGERAAGGMKKAGDAAKHLGGGARSAERDVDRLARAEDRAGRSADRLSGRLRGLFGRMRGGVGAGARGLNGWLTDIDMMFSHGLGAAGGAAGAGVGRGLAWGAKRAALGVGAGAAATFGGAGVLGREVLKTGGQFERYQTQLTTASGSEAEAKRLMDWVTKFAVLTPFTLDQVMEAFIKLKAYGIDPTSGSLKTLGDASAGMGKDVMAAVEALADAQQMQFERLKEFGVKASQKGGFVTFAYTNIKAGKQMEVRVKKNTEEITKALLGIWDTNFGGGMDRLSRTFEGKLSNLSDAWLAFKLKIARAGVFDFVSARLGKFLDWFGDPKNQAKIDLFAKKVSDALVRLFQAAEQIDWEKVGQGVLGFAMLIAEAVDALSKVDQLTSKITGGSLFAGSGKPPPMPKTPSARRLMRIPLYFDTKTSWGKIGFSPPLPVTRAMIDRVRKQWAAIPRVIGGALASARDIAGRGAADLVAKISGKRPLEWAAWFAALPVKIGGALNLLATAGGRAASRLLAQVTGKTPDQWLDAWRRLPGVFTDLWNRVGAAFKGGVDRLWGLLPEWLKKVLTGLGKFAVDLTFNGPTPLLRALGGGGQSQTRVNSAVRDGPALRRAPPEHNAFRQIPPVQPRYQLQGAGGRDRVGGSAGADRLGAGSGQARRPLPLPGRAASPAGAALRPGARPAAAPMAAPLPLPNTSPARPAPAEVGGRIDIRVSSDGSVRATRVSATPGVDLRVLRGEVGGGV
jgi:hypothetical protein